VGVLAECLLYTRPTDQLSFKLRTRNGILAVTFAFASASSIVTVQSHHPSHKSVPFRYPS
jgi:hypothetical protein